MIRDTILVSAAVLSGAALTIVATSNRLANSVLGDHHRMGRLCNRPSRARLAENTYFLIVLVLVID